jgi:hypothetical protein
MAILAIDSKRQFLQGKKEYQLDLEEDDLYPLVDFI